MPCLDVIVPPHAAPVPASVATTHVRTLFLRSFITSLQSHFPGVPSRPGPLASTIALRHATPVQHGSRPTAVRHEDRGESRKKRSGHGIRSVTRTPVAKKGIQPGAVSTRRKKTPFSDRPCGTPRAVRAQTYHNWRVVDMSIRCAAKLRSFSSEPSPGGHDGPPLSNGYPASLAT